LVAKHGRSAAGAEDLLVVGEAEGIGAEGARIRRQERKPCKPSAMTLPWGFRPSPG